jgi:YD repeat-containing protein
MLTSVSRGGSMRAAFGRSRLMSVAWAMSAVALISMPGALQHPGLAQDAEAGARNRRPDVWRRYDTAGQLAAEAYDRNRDGQFEEVDYFDHGRLVKRAIDRDDDSRIDLIEEFDPWTEEPTRSIVDVDRDGIADLLVLFQNGRPAYAKWSSGLSPNQPRHQRHASVVDRDSFGRAVLVDPFLVELAIRAERLARSSGSCSGIPPPDRSDPAVDTTRPQTIASSLCGEPLELSPLNLPSNHASRAPPA